jgi:hypothetical protein
MQISKDILTQNFFGLVVQSMFIYLLADITIIVAHTMYAAIVPIAAPTSPNFGIAKILMQIFRAAATAVALRTTFIFLVARNTGEAEYPIIKKRCAIAIPIGTLQPI